MKPYPQELRDRVLAASDAGQPTKHVAQRSCVSPARVRRPKQRRSETGETAPRPAPRPAGGRRFGKVGPQRLLALWREKKGRTPGEHAARPAGAGVVVSGQGVSRRLVRLGPRHKKRA